MEPFNFSWVIEGFLAASGLPTRASHFKFLKTVGIKHIVNLTEHEACLKDRIKDLTFHHIPIRDHEIPSEKQIQEFLKILKLAQKRNEPTLVHCFAGIGRTGTMIGIWMVSQHGMTPDEALKFIRRKRPRSVETLAQEKLIRNFYVKHFKPPG